MSRLALTENHQTLTQKHGGTTRHAALPSSKEAMPENAPDHQQNSVKEEDSVRLNKALATAGVCSRRKADELIAAGKVMVNGQVVTELGLRIQPGSDTVFVQGKRVLPTVQKQEQSYVVLNKPIQIVSTASDPEGRQTVLDILPLQYKDMRLYPVGRLDYFSEGLILLTNDGELTHRLTHPRYHLPKIYEVTVRERPDPEMLRLMRSGMTLAEGERLSPVEVHISSEDPQRMRLTLHQGVNRQIRRMCRDLGLTILKLVRIAIGPVSLGSLPSGKSRELTRDEVAALKKAVRLQ